MDKDFLKALITDMENKVDEGKKRKKSPHMGHVIKGRNRRVISGQVLNVYLLSILSEDSRGDAGCIATTRVFILTPVLFLIVHRLKKRKNIYPSNL